MSDRGTLKDGEAHPASFNALEWVKSLPVSELVTWSETFASVAMSGNRLAEVCSETLYRLMTGQPVSDRYLLGLAWSMRYAQGSNTSGKKARRAKGEAKGKGKDQDPKAGVKVATRRKRKAGGEGSSSS